MLEAALAFLAGLLIGSFLNVCIYRMPRDLSVARPRSYCPSCNANIPLYSYVALGRKCRNCGAAIPLRYPLVELMTAVVFLLAVLPQGLTLAALKLCLYGALLIGLAFADLEQRILPDEFTLGGILAGVLFAMGVPLPFSFGHLLFASFWGERGLSLSESLLGIFVGAGVLWFVGLLYRRMRHKEGVGLGDVKMIAMVGAFQGLYGAMQTLIYGSILGTAVGLIYIKAAKKDYSTYELPFGTFLAFTALVLALMASPLFSFTALRAG
jgi:leader peptidase (prepilin peptidase)/N-methyltransferase